MEAIKAAVVQAGSALFDTPRTLEKFADLARDAAARGARLAVFPEAFIGGYPKGADFGARVGSRSPEGRDLFRRYFDSAIMRKAGASPVPKPACSRADTGLNPSASQASAPLMLS